MKEESLLLLSDLQKLINQVVLIDYTIIILGGVKMLEHKENKELTEAEVNAYDLVIICYGKLRKDCLTDCLDGTYWLSPEQ